MTGYGSEAVEQSFPTVRVLQKPIERDLLQKIFVANSAGMFFAETRAMA